MESLVDDLLTLSRLENEQNVLHEEQVDVPQLMRTLLGEGTFTEQRQASAPARA